jgi:hypothetical protein
MNDPRDAGKGPMDPAWLDGVLQRSLPPPQLSAGFRARLTAAVQRAGESQALPSRQALAVEYERQVADLRSGYVRLQWRTLGTLLGVAFVCGIGLTLAMPWLRTQLGDWAPLAVAGGGALAGIAIGARSWLRPGLRGPVPQWLGSPWNGA